MNMLFLIGLLKTKKQMVEFDAGIAKVRKIVDMDKKRT